VPYQDDRDGRESYAKQEDQDVQGSHHTEEEATWEKEEELKAEFLSFFSDLSESRGRDLF
jgi:hypothetical protein